jgi:hypothetical protein
MVTRELLNADKGTRQTAQLVVFLSALWCDIQVVAGNDCHLNSLLKNS